MSGDLEVGQIELIVEESLQSTNQPLNQKVILRTGSLLIIFSVTGILNPPMTVSSVDRAHVVLSIIFTFSMSMSLGIGILVLCMGFFIIPRFPTMTSTTTTLVNAGFLLMRVVLGFGTSLVVMAASTPWLILYILFLFIHFV